MTHWEDMEHPLICNRAKTHIFSAKIQNTDNPYIQDLLNDFLYQYDPRELEAAALIVMEEEILQNALNIEKQSLLAKGVFIPTLQLKRPRMLPNGNTGVVNTMDFAQPSLTATSASGDIDIYAKTNMGRNETIHATEVNTRSNLSGSRMSNRPSNDAYISASHNNQNIAPADYMELVPSPEDDDDVDEDAEDAAGENEDKNIDWAPDFS